MSPAERDPSTIRPNTMRKYYKVVDTWMTNNYDAVEAYLSVYPNASRTTASQEFSKIRRIPEIAEYIKRTESEKYENLNITLDRIYAEMARIAFNTDPDYPQTAKIRMLEVLGKNLKEDQGKTANTMKIVIGVEDDDSDILEEEDI